MVSYLKLFAYRKFRGAYNKCIKKFLGYGRCDSMSSIFL